MIPKSDSHAGHSISHGETAVWGIMIRTEPNVYYQRSGSLPSNAFAMIQMVYQKILILSPDFYTHGPRLAFSSEGQKGGNVFYL